MDEDLKNKELNLNQLMNSDSKNSNNNKLNDNLDEMLVSQKKRIKAKKRKKQRLLYAMKRQTYEEAKKEYYKLKNPVFRIMIFIFKFISKFILFIGGIGVIATLVLFFYLWPNIKEARKIAYDTLSKINEDYFVQNQNTEIYDKNGDLLTELGSKSFIYTEYENISPILIDGYIVVEDKNFKTHFGIDPEAILRAGMALVKNKGEITQGGSTITQQLVKNTILTKEQTFSRKIKEMFLAIGIEQDYSKKQIMEWYLNTNFYGENCYGIEAASNYYFNKSAKDLNVAESAIFIGISNAPTKYNPILNYDASMTKAKSILSKMLNGNVISEEEYNDAITQIENGIEFACVTRELKNNRDYLSSYTIEEATKILMRQDNFPFQYTFSSLEEEESYNKLYDEAYSKAYEKLENGGYKIYTSLDKELQKILQDNLDNSLALYSEKTNDIYNLQGAYALIDNNTNYVVALVGGRSGSGEYNRAYQSARQPGSSIKPILDYAPAINSGKYNNGSIVVDEKIEGEFSPSNWYSGYKGGVTLRYAMEQSINTIAWKLLSKIGVEEGLNYLSKLEFSHLSYLDNNNTSISLGGFTYGISPIEMAKAYNTLANNGLYSENTCITKILYRNQCIYESNNNFKEVYTTDTAYMVTDMLKTAITKGICGAAAVPGQIVAGKTGTTNGNKDAWFCGYSKYYTLSLWIGYDTPKTSPITSGMAAKYWASAMTEIHKNLPKLDWEMPETVYKDEESGDFVSKLNKEKLLASGEEMIEDEADRANIDELLTMEEAIMEFEGFEINSIEDANSYSERFSIVLSALNNVSDSNAHWMYEQRILEKKRILDIQYNNLMN